jgi:hypothetical protein
MGFFSFITSDTGKSIANVHSTRKTITVHLITRNGQIFTEESYGGYGNFGSIDIFVLIGKLNGYTGEDDDIRSRTFNYLLNNGITNGEKTYMYREHFANYDSQIPQENNMSANELVQSGQFRQLFRKFSFSEFADRGIHVPKLVQKLPKKHRTMSAEEW